MFFNLKQVIRRAGVHSTFHKSTSNNVATQPKNNLTMICRSALFLVFSNAFILTACTGTPGATLPLFVIAGVQETSGANPRVLVLQDRILEPNLPTDAPRFVSFASQGLAATARAFDTVDEAGTREELVVLSRSQTGSTVTAFLDFFNTRGLLVSDPGTFRTSRSRVDLSTLTFPTALCPVDLEVTRDGNNAVIFNSPSVCNSTFSSANDSLVVLELPSRPPGTTPARVRSTILSNNAPANPLVRTPVFGSGTTRGGLFLDQQNGDSLYYLRQEGSQTVQLRLLSFSAYTSTDSENSTNVQIISDDIPIRSDEFRDMTRVSSNLAILGAGTYVLAPLSVTEGFVPETINTLDVRGQDGRAFIPDATGSSLFILDDNDKIVYHADPTIETNTEADLTGFVSTLNTTSDFLYVAGRNSAGTPLMTIFDLQPLFNEGNTNLESLLIEEDCNAASLEDTDPTNDDGLCFLTNPSALTWAEGILLTEEP
jgi:hypothetical protein